MSTHGTTRKAWSGQPEIYPILRETAINWLLNPKNERAISQLPLLSSSDLKTIFSCQQQQNKASLTQWLSEQGDAEHILILICKKAAVEILSPRGYIHYVGQAKPFDKETQAAKEACIEMLAQLPSTPVSTQNDTYLVENVLETPEQRSAFETYYQHEFNSLEFRLAVLFAATKRFEGTPLNQIFVQWILGPTGSGKSSALNEALAKRVNGASPSPFGDIVVLLIDGEIERNLAHSRNLLERYFSAVKIKPRNLEAFIKQFNVTKCKKLLEKSALLAINQRHPLNLAVPLTLTGDLHKRIAKLKELNHLIQVDLHILNILPEPGQQERFLALLKHLGDLRAQEQGKEYDDRYRTTALRFAQVIKRFATEAQFTEKYHRGVFIDTSDLFMRPKNPMAMQTLKEQISKRTAPTEDPWGALFDVEELNELIQFAKIYTRRFKEIPSTKQWLKTRNQFLKRHKATSLKACSGIAGSTWKAFCKETLQTEQTHKVAQKQIPTPSPSLSSSPSNLSASTSSDGTRASLSSDTSDSRSRFAPEPSPLPSSDADTLVQTDFDTPEKAKPSGTIRPVMLHQVPQAKTPPNKAKPKTPKQPLDTPQKPKHSR